MLNLHLCLQQFSVPAGFEYQNTVLHAPGFEPRQEIHSEHIDVAEFVAHTSGRILRRAKAVDIAT
jgi:hypothetical protein